MTTHSIASYAGALNKLSPSLSNISTISVMCVVFIPTPMGLAFVEQFLPSLVCLSQLTVLDAQGYPRNRQSEIENDVDVHDPLPENIKPKPFVGSRLLDSGEQSYVVGVHGAEVLLLLHHVERINGVGDRR